MPWRKLKEELTCPICLELFSLPRRLPCGHSYCHNCIQVMLEKRAEQTGYYLNRYRALVCPECREELSFDYVRGIEGIPTDFKLSKLVELFHFIKAKDDSDSCEETKSSSLGSSTPGFQVAPPSSAVSPGFLPGDHSTSRTVCKAELPPAPAPTALATPPDTSPESAISQPASCVPFCDEPVSDSALGAVGGVIQALNTATLSSESPDVIKKYRGVQNPINCGGFVVQHSHSPSPRIGEETTKTVLSQPSHITNPSSRGQDVPPGATKLPNTVKTKRSKKSSWKSLFVSDSSSTDSSDSDSHISQGSRSSSRLKNKRWLMTRFLKSVIFSDSSSSSDDSDESRSVNTREDLAQPPHSRAGYITDLIESTNVSNAQPNVQQENNVCNAPVALTESIAPSQSSATLVKEPVERTTPLDTRPVGPEAEATPRLFTETDCCLTFQPAGNQPTLYDNLHSALDQDRLLSTYDNTNIRVPRRGYPNSFSLNRSVQDGNLVNRLPERYIESGPRTHYDNIGNSDLQQDSNSTLTPFTFNEIENLKTGFEHIPDSLFCSQPTPQSFPSAALPNTGESNLGQGTDYNQQAREGVCLPEGFCELAGSPPTSVRLMSPYDNLNPQENCSAGRLNMSQDHPASPTLVITAPEAESEPEPGAGTEPFPHVYGHVVRTDNDFEFDDNYFDTSSEEVSERDLSHLNLAPSSFALDVVGESTLSRSASAGPLVRTSGDSTADTKQSPTTKSMRKEGKGGSSSEEEEDDGSHSGTSMLHNKKKPRSRLKKFLTSLLSLSSSDDEDEHLDVRTSSSSKSSDW